LFKKYPNYPEDEAQNYIENLLKNPLFQEKAKKIAVKEK